MHDDLALGQLHRLPAARAAVGALARDLDRAVGRRPLADAAPRQPRLGVGDAAGLDDVALGIPRGRDRAEPRAHDVGLGQLEPETLDARGPAHEHEQQPGCERVERAGMADPAPPEPAPHRGDDVVRSLPRALVDKDHAVHLAAEYRRRQREPDSVDTRRSSQCWTAPSCSATSERRNATSSSQLIAVEKPAACRCPPPPWTRAMRDTSTRSSDARSETLRSPAVPRPSRSRTSAATAVPSTERRWSMTPSE